MIINRWASKIARFIKVEESKTCHNGNRKSHGGSREPKATLWHFRLFQTNPSQEIKSRERDRDKKISLVA